MAGYQQATYGRADARVDQQPPEQQGYGQQPYPDDEAYGRGFEDGVRSGQTDLQRGKQKDPSKSESYEDAPGYRSTYVDKGLWKRQYRQGYLAGYGRALGDGWTGQDGVAADRRRYPDASGPHDNAYAAANASDPGYQHGYQDGMIEGQRDVRRNKRDVDITRNDRFNDAPGYCSTYGSKDQWKAGYRQGYAAGYQQAWEGDVRR